MDKIVARKLRGHKQAISLLALITQQYPELREANLSQIIARLSPARHSSDFRSVRWFGQSYRFTPAQAIIVSQLWGAWLNGTPEMGSAALLEAADMVSDKISELFKNSEAWGKMICTDNKGIYWLSPESP